MQSWVLAYVPNAIYCEQTSNILSFHRDLHSQISCVLLLLLKFVMDMGGRHIISKINDRCKIRHGRSHGIAHQERNKPKYMNIMAEILKVGSQPRWLSGLRRSHVHSLVIARRSLCPEKLGSNPGQGSKGINFSGWHGLDMSITVTKRR